MGNVPARQPASVKEAEVFHNRETFANFMKSGYVALGLLFVPGVFLALVVLNLLGVSSGALVLPLALALASVMCGFAVLLKKQQFDAVWGERTLTISPQGLSVDNRDLRIDLTWENVRSIERADAMAAQTLTTGVGVADAAGRAAAKASTRLDEALTGPGTITLNPTAKPYIKARIAEYEKTPADQRPAVRIFVEHYEDDWRAGRVGDWVRAYRPDLV